MIKLIPAQAVTSRYNISYQTLNYYTNLGLLVVKKRKGNGRFYDDIEVKRCLGRIDKLKNEGYSLKLICNILRKKV